MSLPLLPRFPEEGLQFLRLLKRNNNREWFQEHKSIYESSLKRPMEEVIHAIADEFEKFAPEMTATPKASLYRIYRDTRFSKDKSPYKTHVAAVFPRQGLSKHEGAGFYLHIEPGDVYAGGGLYMSLPEDLHAVRTHISTNYKRLYAIIESPSFQKMFGGLTGEQLRRVPRGFSADHPAARYLRMKQFLAGRSLNPDVATTPRFLKLVLDSFREILPLIRFLNEPILDSRRARQRRQELIGGGRIIP